MPTRCAGRLRRSSRQARSPGASLVDRLAVPMMDQLQEVMPNVSGMTSFVCPSASGKGSGSSSKRTIVEENAKRTLAATPSKQPGNLTLIALGQKRDPRAEAVKRDRRITI